MEYVRIGGGATDYAKKNLFSSQIGILESVKIYRRYKSLRKDELKLKDFLKKKMTELKNEVDSLDKVLPKVKHEEIPDYKRRAVKKRSDLDIEIEAIRRKIENLK